MSDTGAKYPQTISTASVLPEDDRDWTNASNVGADDATFASITHASFDAGAISYRIKCQNFDFSAIPDGSTIDGILITIDRYNDSGETGKDYRVQLLDANGALVGDNKADTVNVWDTTSTAKNYGGAADTWNATPTAAMIKDVDFGVVLSAIAVDNNCDIYVDYIRMTVYYTPPAGPTLNAYNKILFTSEPPTPNAWNQLKQESGTGYKKLLFV